MAEKDRPLPKFGEWDVNDPASAEGFTVIFNKARDEKKTGGQPGSPPKDDSKYKHREVLGKPHSFELVFLGKKWYRKRLKPMFEGLDSQLKQEDCDRLTK
uniref:RIN4 pathogenic type III effector avirulence factor Avr cleavage site domain-containing protein n=1 Tax=Quercus lobata TaxID=97700 RepID=A0A7N2LIF2_QUELO